MLPGFVKSKPDLHFTGCLLTAGADIKIQIGKIKFDKLTENHLICSMLFTLGSVFCLLAHK